MNLFKIPYGISNYRTIAREGYAYVDKTRYIRILEEYPSPFILLLRPRRFGKSLFASVLNYYYDIAEKDNFQHLFLNTEIGHNPTTRKNSYFVLNFNFSGIASGSESELYESFRKKARNALQLFIVRYNLDVELQNSGSAADQLSEFFMSIASKIDRSVYVIIDEYDQFANELLSFHLPGFQNSIGRNGFVRKWYEVLKEATATIVDRIFITGVSPITLDSLTSGFNISDNISRLSLVNAIMGFTGEEIHTQDTMQEKLSLSDRFGLTVTFPPPGQQLYLQIVEHLVQERGIEMDAELLRQKALEWERAHHGRSGRTAHQFVNSLSNCHL